MLEIKVLGISSLMVFFFVIPSIPVPAPRRNNILAYIIHPLLNLIAVLNVQYRYSGSGNTGLF